jgi:chromosome segregation ATPase
LIGRLQVTSRAVSYLENCFIDFRQPAGELNENSQGISTALTTFSNELNSNCQRVATALTTFSKRIDEVKTPEDLLSIKLAPIFQSITEAAEQTAGRVSSERQRNQNVAKLTLRLEGLAGSMDGILDRVADKEGRVTTAIQQAVNVAGQTAELCQQIREWTERFTYIEAKQTEILGVLSRASEGAQERDRARDESLRKTLTDTLSAIGEYEARVQSLLQSHSESFEAELKRAERAFTTLSVTLSEGASLLASELGRGNGLERSYTSNG